MCWSRPVRCCGSRCSARCNISARLSRRCSASPATASATATVLFGMRATYAMLAAILMALAFAGVVTPLLVLSLRRSRALVRPSDLGVRGALIAETMPNERLIGAMSIARTTTQFRAHRRRARRRRRVRAVRHGAGLCGHHVLLPAGALFTLGIAEPRRHISLAHDAGRSASVALARPQGRHRARLEHADLAGDRVARIPGQSHGVPAHQRIAALCGEGRLSRSTRQASAIWSRASRAAR